MDINSPEVIKAQATLDALMGKESGSIIEPNREKGPLEEVELEGNSDVNGDNDVVDTTRGMPDTLYNDLPPNYVRQREKAWHRIAIRLKATGMSNVQIADELGVSAQTVADVMRQPWATGMLMRLLHQTGDKAIRRLHDAAEDAAKTLIDIMASAENLEVKRKVCNDILDRKYGKPNQPYSAAEKAAHELTDAELAKLAQAQQN